MPPTSQFVHLFFLRQRAEAGIDSMARGHTLVIHTHTFVGTQCFGVPHLGAFKERKRSTRVSSSVFAAVLNLVNKAVGRQPPCLVVISPVVLLTVGCPQEAKLQALAPTPKSRSHLFTARLRGHSGVAANVVEPSHRTCFRRCDHTAGGVDRSWLDKDACCFEVGACFLRVVCRGRVQLAGFTVNIAKRVGFHGMLAGAPLDMTHPLARSWGRGSSGGGRLRQIAPAQYREPRTTDSPGAGSESSGCSRTGLRSCF